MADSYGAMHWTICWPGNRDSRKSQVLSKKYSSQALHLSYRHE